MYDNTDEVVRADPETPAKKRMCVGTVCLGERCLYYFGVALVMFMTLGPAAVLSQDHVDPRVTIALGVIAAASLLFVAFACAINFLSALNKKYYNNLRNNVRTPDR
jgi:uncharacterized membrane protein YedE/YeeE